MLLLVYQDNASRRSGDDNMLVSMSRQHMGRALGARKMIREEAEQLKAFWIRGVTCFAGQRSEPGGLHSMNRQPQTKSAPEKVTSPLMLSSTMRSTTSTVLRRVPPKMCPSHVPAFVPG